MSQHKEEALKAIKHAREMTTAGAGDNGMGRKMIHAALEYAAEQIEAIIEVKRVRKPRVVWGEEKP